jgi:hypothetical protein
MDPARSALSFCPDRCCLRAADNGLRDIPCPARLRGSTWFQPDERTILEELARNQPDIDEVLAQMKAANDPGEGGVKVAASRSETVRAAC